MHQQILLCSQNFVLSSMKLLSHSVVFISVSQLQDHLPSLRRPILLYMRRRERQQSLLLGGDTQLRRGAQRILPQRLRTGPGVQLLQSVLGGRRDVLGRRDSRDVTNQSIEATADIEFVRVSTSITRTRPPQVGNASEQKKNNCKTDYKRICNAEY